MMIELADPATVKRHSAPSPIPVLIPLRLESADALLVVDVQRDFLPGGAMTISGSERILPRLNACMAKFVSRGLPVFASRDWHPHNHRSFASQGGPWPPHCIQGSMGAQWADGLWLPENLVAVSKGKEADALGSSAFDATDLTQRLRQAGVHRLFMGGLATDTCILHTARDALAQGWEVVVLGDAVAALDVKLGDGLRALQMIQREGGEVAEVSQLMV
jgi:nicotinamidase/pyrazinamidase